MNRFAMLWAPAAALALALAGCQDRQGAGGIAGPVTGNATSTAVQKIEPFSEGGGHASVYTLSNESGVNNVLRFFRSASGTLSPGGSFATGGTGTGAGLGSQGAIYRGEQYIYAVNGGSNDISVLVEDGGGLHIVSKTSSGGMQPISLTVHGDLLFVLNAGGAGNISGFRGAGRGILSPIPGSTKPLSGSSTQPAEVAFSPDGRSLVVTEKATNVIDTYEVRDDGRISGPLVQNSAGHTPYGFAFSERGPLVVSEVEDKTPGGSTLSSYRIVHDGLLKTISGKVPDGQTAACWVVITNDGRFAYTTNAGTNDVSGYRLGANGALSLFGDGGVTATCDGAPIDMALSRGSDFLYVLNSGGRSISTFRVDGGSGSLTLLGKNGGLPASVSGLAAD